VATSSSVMPRVKPQSWSVAPLLSAVRYDIRMGIDGKTRS
jgi:hypothetical protein